MVTAKIQRKRYCYVTMTKCQWNQLQKPIASLPQVSSQAMDISDSDHRYNFSEIGS